MTSRVADMTTLLTGFRRWHHERSRLLYLYGARNPEDRQLWPVHDESKPGQPWEVFTSTYTARTTMDRYASTGEWDELAVYDADAKQHIYGWTRDPMRPRAIINDF